MIADKKSQYNIFCLFHQSDECLCPQPVVEDKILIFRIHQEIEMKNRLNKFDPNAEKKDQRRQEVILLERRLADLKE